MKTRCRLIGWILGMLAIQAVALELPWEREPAPQPPPRQETPAHRPAPTARPGESAEIAELRLKAEAGDLSAKNALGRRYRIGDGLPQDDHLAVHWYRRSAEGGSALGQANLGWMYSNGRGVPQDDRKAVEWYRRAAEQGNLVATNNLGNMYLHGRGVPQDDRLAAQWFHRAAQHGHATSQYVLGYLYEHGRGVDKNLKQALEWYRQAADNGSAAATEAYQRLGASSSQQIESIAPQAADDADPLPLPERAFLDFRGWGEMTEEDSISGVKDITSMIIVRQGPIVFHGNRFQGGLTGETSAWSITGTVSRNPTGESSPSRISALISFEFTAGGTCPDGHAFRRKIGVRDFPISLYTHAPDSVNINTSYAVIDQTIYRTDPDLLLQQVSYETFRHEKGGYNVTKRTHEPDKTTTVTLKRIMRGQSEGPGHPFMNWSLDLRHAPSAGWPDSAIRAWQQQQEQHR